MLQKEKKIFMCLKEQKSYRIPRWKNMRKFIGFLRYGYNYMWRCVRFQTVIVFPRKNCWDFLPVPNKTNTQRINFFTSHKSDPIKYIIGILTRFVFFFFWIWEIVQFWLHNLSMKAFVIVSIKVQCWNKFFFLKNVILKQDWTIQLKKKIIII